MARAVYTTVDVNFSTQDFWSPAARAAAAEARKRRATAVAGRAAGAAARGKADGGKMIRTAAKAHAAVHGEEHGKEFERAAHAHIARAEQRKASAQKALKSGRKVGLRVGLSAVGAYKAQSSLV